MKTLEHFRSRLFEFDNTNYYHDWSQFEDDPRTSNIELHLPAGQYIDKGKFRDDKINIITGAEWPNGWFGGKTRGMHRKALDDIEGKFDYILCQCKMTASKKGNIFAPYPLDVNHLKSQLNIRDINWGSVSFDNGSPDVKKDIDVFMCGNSKASLQSPLIPDGGGPCPLVYWENTIKDFNYVWCNASRKPVPWHEKQMLSLRSKISIVWVDFFHATKKCIEYSQKNYDWIRFKPTTIDKGVSTMVTPQTKTKVYDASFSKSIMLCYKGPFHNEDSPYNSLIEDLFEEGVDFIYFEDCDDLHRKISEILKDYENPKYKKMVDSAYDKLVNNLNIDVFYEKYIVPLAEKGKTK